MYVKKILIFLIKKILFFCVFLDRNILQIPLAVVILGCIASLLLLIGILILLSSHARGK